MRLTLEHWASPVATLLLVADNDGVLRALEYADHEARLFRLLQSHYGAYSLELGKVSRSITQCLDDYFHGEIDALDEILVATGGTEFQRKVWKGLRAIPAGTTISYRQLAANIGREGAYRAVGAANGANPISLVVPCHRVIGANGALIGYASGLPRKRWLLDHERRFATASQSSNPTGHHNSLAESSTP